MKIINIIFIISLLLTSITQNTFSQKCAGFEKQIQISSDKVLKKSLSKSFAIKEKEVIAINHIFYENNEYFISVKGSKKLGKIRIKLLDENKKVLFDNSLANFKTSQNFIIEKTMPIRIELSAPDYSSIHYECLGIKVYFDKL